MFKSLGTIEVVVVSAVLLLLFGSKKLNELARGLGESKKEIEKAKAEYEKAVAEEEINEAEGGEV